jgi:penicillin-binding protein 2
MYLRSDGRSPEMNNSIALRIGIFGGVSLALFVILFFRLWFLQELNGKKYLAEANNNRTREFRVSAPRGNILDREGEVMVTNRTSLAIQVNTQKLSEDPKRRHAEMTQLAELTHTTLPRLQRTIREELARTPGAPATVRRDVGHFLVYYLEENKTRFPGVAVERVFVRSYPHGALAAHILGNVGEINEEELKEPRYKGLEPGDLIGKEGVEETYDPYLRGSAGVTRIQVDAFGQPTQGGKLVSQRPIPGDSLKLSIDRPVQEAGEAALAARGLRGAFVTMNIHTGEILGIGSFPTFDPSVFTKPMTQSQVNALYRDPIAAPLTDRATAGLYPTGSTFKPITAIAALESGKLTPSEVIYDPGKLTVGGEEFTNAGEAANGSVSLVLRMWDTGQLQKWAHALGIGRPTGIDLPGAAEGLLPSKHWRDQLYKEGETERPWSAGDNVQLATGQGDLQTNPLQMAIAYATIGNGGTVVTPHVGLEVDDAAGRVVREFDPSPRRHVHMNPEYRADILEGMHDAAQNGAGTSFPVFGNFPIPVAGKTGTAQRPPYADQSWYGVLAPYPNPKYITFVTMEEGGFGVEAAAPAARIILEALFAKQLSSEGSEGEEAEEGHP